MRAPSSRALDQGLYHVQADDEKKRARSDHGVARGTGGWPCKQRWGRGQRSPAGEVGQGFGKA